MARDLSMSMRLDTRSTFPEFTLQARTPTTWIPDARVQRCFACNVEFSIFRRKHHCRSCGRIFCAACTSYREKIPSYYRSYTPSPSQMTETQRMCAKCASKLRQSIEVEWILRILSNLPIKFPELFCVRLLNKDWNLATNTMLSMYRGLLYKLPCQEYTTIERNFLRTHFAEFGHHIPWQIHTLCALQSVSQLSTFDMNPTFHGKLSCKWLLCSRTCHKKMSVDDIIRLGMAGCLQHTQILTSVIASWQQMSADIHRNMMFWWVRFACQHAILFTKGLIPICLHDLNLVYALWFECQLQESRLLKQVQIKLQQSIPEKFQQELATSIAFVDLLQTIVTKSSKSTHQYYINSFFSSHKIVRLPWQASVMVKSLKSKKRFASSSKPLAVTCFLTNGVEFDILIKQEDIRTDRLAMVIGYWISSVTKHVHIHSYDVFPFSDSAGCLVMIPNASTLYDIRKTTTLLNFVMTHNPNLTSRQMRERMVASCAGACLLAFTMGLGDRHLENIMVTQEGYLAHVDFGYVLGDDPKHVSTPMRITEDMIDAMGGKASPTFVSFIQRTQKGYEAMRFHASFWYHLLSSDWFIFADKSRPWKRIRDHVLDRFVPGEWDEEASLQIQTVVETATKDSILQRAADFMHLTSNKFGELFHMEL